METLNEYISRLHTALEKKRPYVTYNRDKSHASLVVSAGFLHAENKIRILSHELDPEVYASPSLLTSVVHFLEKETILNVLVEKEISEDHPISSLIKGEYGEKITIKRVPDYIQEQYECNFMLIDSFGYRFEPDRKKPNAMVAFYNEDHSHMFKMIERFFGILDELAEQITVPQR